MTTRRKRIQYRCSACGQYSSHLEDKRYMKSYCMQEMKEAKLIRVKNE
jgi:hypothetical protein